MHTAHVAHNTSQEMEINISSNMQSIAVGGRGCPSTVTPKWLYEMKFHCESLIQLEESITTKEMGCPNKASKMKRFSLLIPSIIIVQLVGFCLESSFKGRHTELDF